MIVKVFTTRVELGYVANVVRLDVVDDDTFKLCGSSTTYPVQSRYAARVLAAEQLGVTYTELRNARGQCVL